MDPHRPPPDPAYQTYEGSGHGNSPHHASMTGNAYLQTGPQYISSSPMQQLPELPYSDFVHTPYSLSYEQYARSQVQAQHDEAVSHHLLPTEYQQPVPHLPMQEQQYYQHLLQDSPGSHGDVLGIPIMSHTHQWQQSQAWTPEKYDFNTMQHKRRHASQDVDSERLADMMMSVQRARHDSDIQRLSQPSAFPSHTFDMSPAAYLNGPSGSSGASGTLAHQFAYRTDSDEHIFHSKLALYPQHHQAGQETSDMRLDSQKHEFEPAHEARYGSGSAQNSSDQQHWFTALPEAEQQYVREHLWEVIRHSKGLASLSDLSKQLTFEAFLRRVDPDEFKRLMFGSQTEQEAAVDFMLQVPGSTHQINYHRRNKIVARLRSKLECPEYVARDHLRIVLKNNYYLEDLLASTDPNIAEAAFEQIPTEITPEDVAYLTDSLGHQHGPQLVHIFRREKAQSIVAALARIWELNEETARYHLVDKYPTMRQTIYKLGDRKTFDEAQQALRPRQNDILRMGEKGNKERAQFQAS